MSRDRRTPGRGVRGRAGADSRTGPSQVRAAVPGADLARLLPVLLRSAVVVATAVAVTLTTASDRAQAFWGTSGTGAGGAALATLAQAATPTVQVTKNAVTLGWAAATLSNGIPVTGYTVTRYNSSNVAQTVLNGCAGTITTTTCTETGVPDGLYTYTVTPVFSSWHGPASARSPQVQSDGTAPVLTVARNAVSGGSFLNGPTLYYRGVDAGSVTLKMVVSDAGSGPASATTGALTGTTTGWTHTPSTVTTPSGGPYVSNPLSWAAGTTGTATSTVSATDVAGNSSAPVAVSLVNDSTAPTGATLTYPAGWDSTTGAYSATTLALGLGTVTDAGSGITTANRSLQERTAPLSGNTCGTFGAWSELATVSASTVTRNNLSYDTCYDYRYVVTDNVGNTVTVASPGVVKNRSYANTVQNTSGLVDYYRLGDVSGSTTAVDAETTANNGTWGGGPTLGAAGAIRADTNTAATFDGVDDYASIPRTISTDFSIEFWFKSTGGIGYSDRWYDGAGLVDGEVGGIAYDFGTSLTQGGAVCAGTGNTDNNYNYDTTICSNGGYGDNAWHHVVFTRSSAGSLTLYIDGAVRATGTGTANPLTAPSNLRIGSIHTQYNYFTGSMDEVALYNTVLPAATVTNHYQTGTG
jgi:hypothetical protein